MRNMSGSTAPLAPGPCFLSYQKHLSQCKWVHYKSTSNVQFQDETAVCEEMRKTTSPYKSWDGLAHFYHLGGGGALGEERGRRKREKPWKCHRYKLSLLWEPTVSENGLGLLARVWWFACRARRHCEMSITTPAEPSAPAGCGLTCS